MRKLRLISKFMTSQTGQQIIKMLISSSILKSKGNHIMNLSINRIKHEKYIFLGNHTQNVVQKPVPDPFIKRQKSAYLLINNLKYYKVCFSVFPSRGLPITLRLRCRPFVFFILFKGVLKIKKRSGISPLRHFPPDF